MCEKNVSVVMQTSAYDIWHQTKYWLKQMLKKKREMFFCNNVFYLQCMQNAQKLSVKFGFIYHHALLHLVYFTFRSVLFVEYRYPLPPSGHIALCDDICCFVAVTYTLHYIEPWDLCVPCIVLTFSFALCTFDSVLLFIFLADQKPFYAVLRL